MENNMEEKKLDHNMQNDTSNELSEKKKKPLILNFSSKKKKDDAKEIPSVSSDVQEGISNQGESLNNNVVSSNDSEPVMENNLTTVASNEVKEVVPSDDIPNLASNNEEKLAEVTPIFNSSAIEEEVPILKESKDNFVPPADFSSIFNVESEEKTSTPVAKLDNEEVKAIDQPVTLGSEVSTNEQVSKSEKKAEVFNSNERLLYEIKPEKEANPIVVILFFLLLFGAIVMLPYISQKIDFEAGNTNVTASTTETEESDSYYFNKSSIRVKMDGLEFTNFVKSKNNGEYFLTFNITNTTGKAYQFDKKYYVTFLDGEAVVYRALIHSYEAMGANAAQEVTLTISERGYNSADQFRIEEIPVSAYPDVSVTEKDGDYSVLTCNYNNDEIKYYFQEGKLAKLRETYTETIDNSRSYENNKAAYKNLSNSYKNVSNFTSTFIEGNTYFTMINEFNHKDIADATLANLKTYKFFRYNEVINTVSFELEAQGYVCG